MLIKTELLPKCMPAEKHQFRKSKSERKNAPGQIRRPNPNDECPHWPGYSRMTMNLREQDCQKDPEQGERDTTHRSGSNV